MRLLVSLVATFFAFAVHAEQGFEYWPDADYDPAIPTIQSVLGHNPGERISWHHEAIRYFEALAAAQPDRMVMHRYAKSWEGRELIYAVITSPGNMARIDEIKKSMQSLRNADDTSNAEANRIIANEPAVTWLSYGVHGDEISSTDAAMLTAYHLLASRGDDRVSEILANSVVVIDPIQNPDGRDRFIHGFEMAEGLRPDPYRYAAEHDQPWPSGRVNHYLFDMNRDWFVMSQPETQGRVAAMQEWYPVAVVDLHEMGGDQTYYFAPAAQPSNPNLTSVQAQLQEMYGRNNAAWLDRFGIDYFHSDIFDDFYAGYGSSWPSYFGATAMTYEQAGIEGLIYRQYDGTEWTYAESVRNHFVTSMATAETTATNREMLLREFHNYQLSAIEEGRSGAARSYIIPRQADQAGANRLAGRLVRQGVEVGVANAGFSACGENYEAGSYVIDMAQPAERLVRTLLDKDVPMAAEFLAEQVSRRERGVETQIYDVTAWSVPLMMNVEADSCNRLPSVATTPAGSDLVLKPDLPAAEAKVAYLVPWGEATAVRFLSHALQAGISVKSSDEAFTLQGKRYPGGTVIIDVADNGSDDTGNIHQAVREISSLTGASVDAIDNGWVTDGPSLGADRVVRHKAPDVALAWDDPTSPYSAGQTRFVIERQFDYPVTAIRTSRMASIDLSGFEVLILPTTYGDYKDVLGEAGIENLRDWVNKGGVLIALGDANEFLADPEVDLISIRRENAFVEEAEKVTDDSEEKKDPTVEGILLTSEEDYRASIKPVSALPDSVSGALLKANVTAEHWLGAGVASSIHVLARGTGVYTPIRLDDGVNVARFAAADDLLASGFMWPENRDQLAYKPFAAVQASGQGFVIAFTFDPNIRAYLDGLNVIFMNAIFRGAAHARPLH